MEGGIERLDWESLSHVGWTGLISLIRAYGNGIMLRSLWVGFFSALYDLTFGFITYRIEGNQFPDRWMELIYLVGWV